MKRAKFTPSTVLKTVALRAVAAGIAPPENPINRFQELTQLKRLLAVLGVNCVLDVGANQGQYSSELRAIGYDGYIVSFEPVEQEFAALKNRFRDDPKWTGHQIALGAECTTTQINVFTETVFSSLLPLTRTSALSGHAVQAVKLHRLDSMLPSILPSISSPRIFLKMDTQGYDLKVFEGAAGCQGGIVGLQSELSVHSLYQGQPHYLEALAAYENAGFRLYDLSTVGRGRDGGLVEVNCFMSRSATKLD